MKGRSIFVKLVKGYKKLRKGRVEERAKPPVILFKEAEAKEPEAEKVKFEGVEIPEFRGRVRAEGIESEMEGEKVSLTYPLIPEKPKKNDVIYAYVKIRFDDRLNKYVYEVVEPRLTRKLRKLLYRLKDLIEERLDVDFSKLRKEEAKEYLHRQASDLLDYLGVKLNSTERSILFYYIDRDFIGLGKIEAIMHDKDIEDISCDGVGIPIFVFHRNPRLGSLITNISFETAEELDAFIVRLAQLCGKSVSVAYPILDGSLPDGSRVQATLATDIARKGSNFTIRKFTKEPLTPTHVLNWGTIDVRALAYLWMAVDYGCSIMISGGTATGKTSFLNILSLFIRPESKIVSIEDTPELQLPHPHWVPHIARTPIAAEGSKEIDMFTLLKESLRQRPDYIIVGEVRGREAYVLFQQMATGHAALATMHADSLERLIDRLTTPPISLPSSLIQNLDVVLFLVKARYRGKFVRRVKEVLEIVDFDVKTNRPVVNKVFEWNSYRDKIEVKEKSYVLKKIAEKFGFSEKKLKEELQRRMLVLKWMQENNLIDYMDVSKVINSYYNFPERIIAAISGEVR